MSVTVTITSDFICPWCFIGERRLARAVGMLSDGLTIERKWRPFELNPDMRPEGMDRRTYRSLKFGSWERSQMLDAHTVEAAKDEGIAFEYAAIAKTPNTFLAHRLMWFAERRGLATPLAEAIFSAYFERGRDIGDAAALVDIAAGIEIEREQVDGFLLSDQGAQEIREAEQGIRARGVRGVPLFDIDGEIVSGAQSLATFEAVLGRAFERTKAAHGGDR